MEDASPVLQPAGREADRQAEVVDRVRQLGSRNPWERSSAARRLGELKTGAGPLLAALRDRNGHVRAAAAAALGSLDASEMEADVVEGLLEAIDDPVDEVCEAAIRSLGRLGAVEASGQIAACLDDRNARIVRAAILALGRLGSHEHAPRLMGFLDADVPFLRSAAASALATLGHAEAIPRLLEGLRTALRQERGAASRLPLCADYIRALGRLRAEEAVPLLVQIARTEVGLRSCAVETLAAMGAQIEPGVLAELLADPGHRLHASVLRLLAQSGRPVDLPQVRQLLAHEDEAVQRVALEIVVRAQDIESAPLIRRLCYRDPHPYLRPIAVASLAALLGEQAVPDLLALAEDPNSLVRRAAAQALGRVNGTGPEVDRVLQRLAYDQHAGPAARAALAARGLSAAATGVAEEEEVDGQGCAEPAEAVGVPPDIRPHTATLLHLLGTWQDALIGRPGRDAADAVAALAVLIAQLRCADEPEQDQHSL